MKNSDFIWIGLIVLAALIIHDRMSRPFLEKHLDGVE